MRTLRSTLLALVFGALALLVAPCQTHNNTEHHALPRYDPAQEVKVKGEILEIKNYDCPISGTMGAHLSLQTAEGVVEVHLAPAAFLSEYHISFAKGDKVVVLGNKVVFHDAPAMLARQVVRNDDAYFFRDAQGRPLWAARRAPNRT